MKANFPVTDREIPLPLDRTLVSKTDLKGIITYANEAFVEISGYTREELIGKNHNLVRHPDMPPQAFSWLWRTMKQDRPWRGIVKNRAKNGDFYWVEAFVVPIRKNSQTIGYMSVRSTPSREKIQEAEALYKTLNETGAEIPDDHFLQRLSIKTQLRLSVGFMSLLMLAGGGLGLGGLHLANNSMDRLYQARLEPVTALSQIKDRVQESRALFLQARLNTAAAQPYPSTIQATLQRHQQEIEQFVQIYQTNTSDLKEKQDVEGLSRSLKLFHQQLLQPNTSLETLLPLFQKINGDIQSFQKSLVDGAKNDYQDTVSRYETIRIVAIAGIILGIGFLTLGGILLVRTIIRPLDTAIGHFNQIAQGKLSGEIDIQGYGETGKLVRAIATMQLHLKVMLDEISLASSDISYQCSMLNQTMLSVADHSEEQFDRVQDIVQDMEPVNQGFQRLASSSTTLQHLAEKVNQRAAHLTQLEVSQTPEEAKEESELWQKLAEESIDLANTARQFASDTRLQSFSAEDINTRMQHISRLIMENREAVQKAWQASQEIRNSVHQLNALVRYFD